MAFWPRQNVFKRVVVNASVVATANCERQPSYYPFAFYVFWLRPQFSYQVCPSSVELAEPTGCVVHGMSPHHTPTGYDVVHPVGVW